MIRWLRNLVKRLRGPSYGELIELVENWAADRYPEDCSECDLMIALWRRDGDRLKPCPGCDGDCEEPCAPTTAAQEIAALQQLKRKLHYKYCRPANWTPQNLSDYLYAKCDVDIPVPEIILWTEEEMAAARDYAIWKEMHRHDRMTPEPEMPVKITEAKARRQIP